MRIVSYLDYKSLDKDFYTNLEVRELLGLTKAQYKRFCQKFDISTVTLPNSDKFGLSRNDLRRLHNFIYNLDDDEAVGGEDQWD